MQAFYSPNMVRSALSLRQSPRQKIISLFSPLLTLILTAIVTGTSKKVKARTSIIFVFFPCSNVHQLFYLMHWQRLLWQEYIMKNKKIASIIFDHNLHFPIRNCLNKLHSFHLKWNIESEISIYFWAMS